MNKSIIENDFENRCFLCGLWSEHLDVHHIFGAGVRKQCDKRGLYVHVCRNCHRLLHDKEGEPMEFLHQIGQRTYEEMIGTREQFIKEFIRSYL